MTSPKEQIITNIVKLRDANGLRIHPGQDPSSWADLVIKKGGCPCVPGRTHCPCDQVMADVAELGRCRCGLFCNDRYLAEYYRLKGDSKNGRKCQKPAAQENHH